MLARKTRAPLLMLAFLAPLALLTACGGGGGTGGGNSGGGGGGGGGGSTTTSSGTGTTSSGKGCIDLCTELDKCPGIMMTDCATACPDVDKLNQDGMCTDTYDALVMCILASSDTCNAYDNECNDQAADYTSCTSDYCSANTSPACP